MTPTLAYTEASHAAKLVAGAQHYPTGALYVVATPIGNLADISLRALYLLGLVDTVACEDTRHTGQLLHAYGLHKPLLALHEHNENQAAQIVITKLKAGERVAYVSDAGTPAVSDPGSRLVALVQAQGLRIVPMPGASSVTTVLSVAGCAAKDDAQAGLSSGFTFAGFLPPKGAERARALAQLDMVTGALVLLEAPHRIKNLLDDLAVLDARKVTVGRELTKQFESVQTMPAKDLPDWLSQDSDRARGEFVLVIHPKETSHKEEQTDAASTVLSMSLDQLLTRLLTELPLKTAVQVAVDLSGQAKNTVYERALHLKNECVKSA